MRSPQYTTEAAELHVGGVERLYVYFLNQHLGCAFGNHMESPYLVPWRSTYMTPNRDPQHLAGSFSDERSLFVLVISAMSLNMRL